MIANLLLILALATVAITAIAVGMAGQIARTRAAMVHGFVSRGRRYRVIEEPETELWPEAELDGRALFSPTLDHEHGGNIDRRR